MTWSPPAFAERTAHLDPSVIREILRLVAQPDIISFAGGMPPPDLFPVEALAAAAQRALEAGRAPMALQYGPSEGYMPLREAIASLLADEGVNAPVEDVVITTGSQQAIDLVARVLLDPGDEVVVCDPTFLGALQSFSGFEARYLPVPIDQHGMRTDVLAEVLAAHRPKLIYTIPTFQNPTGASMSEARKAELYALARAHGVVVLEDDPYGELYFGDRRPLPIKALDRDNEVVALCRTFSKILAPGLRVGYMALPPALRQQVLAAKQAADLHTSALAQVTIHEWLETGALPGHMAAIRPVYRHRRDMMLAAMAAHFPQACRWQAPDGGLFIWVELPDGISSEALLKEAVARHVAYIPGRAFFAGGGGANTFRLNFSNAGEAQIQEGIRRLGEVIGQALEMPSLI